MVASNSTSLIRANRLLNYLIKSSDFVSLKEIIETFNISRRTAFNWLETINQNLRKHNLDEIVNVPRYGYKITNRTRKKLINERNIMVSKQDYNYENNLHSIDRQTVIILLLIQDDYLSINKLAKKFNCSRNTIIKDFKTINGRFPQLKIASSRMGHKITGNEVAIRLTIYKLLLYQNRLTYSFIKDLRYSISKARQLVINTQQRMKINFSENSIEQLAYLLVFIKWRILKKFTIQEDSEYNWIATNTTNVLTTCEDLLRSLIGEKVCNGEIVFFSKIILCSQATEVNCVNKNLYKDLNNIAQDIIFRYEQLTEQQISYKLFTKVLCNHLYATFFRVKFDVPFSSSEVDEIKRQYPELIKFTTIACAPLENYLRKKLPSEEIALICLYLGSVSQKNYHDLTNSDKFRRASLADVLVVCSSGIGTSAMLYQELRKMYPLIKFSLPLEIRDLPNIFKHDYQAKLIISTAILSSTKYPIPVVNVRAVITKHDQSLIENILRQKYPLKVEHNTSVVNSLVSIINEYADVKDESGLRQSIDHFIFPKSKNVKKSNLPTLGSILPTERIMVYHNNTTDLTWQKALQLGCNLLERDGIIDQYYFEKIVQLINQYGPYMLIANDIFLAHAAPSISNKNIGLSLILFDHSLEINTCNQYASVTCLFVLSPGLKHEHEKALEQLVDIVRDNNNVERLLKAESPRDVRKILLSCS